jgi:OOP family OmpA-OmpF porin
MRNPILTAAFAMGLFISAAGVASAAEQAGPYVSFGAGANFLNDADISGSGASNRAKFSDGWATVGALGYAFDKNWRSEFELGYRRNDIDSLQGGGNAGNVNSWSFMGNVLYDVDTGTKWTPYVGAGVGALRYRAAGLQPTATSSLNDSDTVFAYQGILGIAYDVTPRTQFYVDYHYLRADDPSVSSSTGANLDSEYHSNTILLGFRYSLGSDVL